MHVLILPSWYFNAETQEIQGRMFHQHAEAMRKEGVDARIFFAQLGPYSSLIKKHQFKIEDGVPTWRVHQWMLPKLNSFLTHLWIQRYVGLLMDYIKSEGKPDLIHAQSFLAGFVAAALKKKTGIPFLVTERLSGFITGKIPQHYHSLIRKSFNEADVITCVSPGLKRHLVRYTSQPIDVIPNFYDPDLFYYDPAIEKNKIYTWVSIGEPAKIKGLDVLIKAYGELRKKTLSQTMQLILVDKIKEKDELNKMISEYGISNEIKWTGLVNQKEIAHILRESHVLISSSRAESFGKAIVEAQACGLPVIATKTDGAKFILESPEQGIFVEIDDVKGMTDAMEQMFTKYGRYHGEKINKSVSARFNDKVVAEMWKKKYIEMLS